MPDSIRKEFFNLGEELIPAITEIHVGNLIAKKESLEAIDELIRKVSRYSELAASAIDMHRRGDFFSHYNYMAKLEILQYKKSN